MFTDGAGLTNSHALLDTLSSLQRLSTLKVDTEVKGQVDHRLKSNENLLIESLIRLVVGGQTKECIWIVELPQCICKEGCGIVDYRDRKTRIL